MEIFPNTGKVLVKMADSLANRKFRFITLTAKQT